MKQNPKMNIAMLQLMSTNQLKKWYQDFKNFMNESDLPDFSVKLIDDYGTSKEASISPPTSKNDKFIFKIRKSLIMVKKDNAKCTAFHEFTHIYDDCKILQECDIRTRVKLIKLYSEYHATQIQLMCACQFSNVSQNKELSDSEIVYDNMYPRPIKDYLLFLTADYKATIAERTNKNILDGYNILLHTIYYISSIDFFKKFCNFNITPYIDEIFCIDLCGIEIIELLVQYRQSNLTLNDFEKMSTLDLRIAKNIYNKYKQ